MVVKRIDMQLGVVTPAHRERLPETRDSVTRKFKIARPGHRNGDLKMYVAAELYPDGRSGKIFISSDHTSSLASGALDLIGIGD
jgi:hypothetical protein